MKLLLSGIYLLLVGLMVLLIDNAPEGYEDADGFHYGKPL